MVQINQKNVYGAETPRLRGFLGGIPPCNAMNHQWIISHMNESRHASTNKACRTSMSYLAHEWTILHIQWIEQFLNRSLDWTEQDSLRGITLQSYVTKLGRLPHTKKGVGLRGETWQCSCACAEWLQDGQDADILAQVSFVQDSQTGDLIYIICGKKNQKMRDSMSLTTWMAVTHHLWKTQKQEPSRIIVAKRQARCVILWVSQYGWPVHVICRRSYWVAKIHRLPYLGTSFSAKEPYN